MGRLDLLGSGEMGMLAKGIVMRGAAGMAMTVAVALLAGEPTTARADVLDLEGALARARSGSPVLRAAASEVEAARGRLSQARLFPSNPVLSGDAARHTGPGEEQIDRGVSLAQEIEVGGQRGLRVGAATYDVAHAEHALADRRRLVEAEVRRAFFSLAAIERRRVLATEAVALADRIADTARRRAHAGDVGALDVRLAEVETAHAAQTLGAAESERAAAVARLATALGAPPEEAIDVSAEERAPSTLPPEATLVERALATRPDLIAAREERTRLEAEAGLVHRRGLVPNPVLRGFYREELFKERIAGGEVSIPLPVWNREQGTEATLRAQAAGASAEVSRLLGEIPRQVHVALVRRTVAAETWTRYRDAALPATSRARADIERAFAAGYLGLPEVLVQQDRLLQVQGAAIDTWRELNLAESDLIEALGESP
ncbi:MAG TPA: TolC family protein [Candidatus Nitrosopolaris sp.]|nr:TolC family protein [Candidatus Nitrosopolaris sp.]